VSGSLSAARLAQETAASPERIRWLERIGILRPAGSDRYEPSDAFRVRMIVALLEAGFTEDEVSWAASEGGLDLGHIDAYPLTEPAERSDRPFEAFADSLGLPSPSAMIELYRVLGLPEPEPGAALRRDEETLFVEFLRVWGLADDDEVPARAARLIGEGTRLATMGWSELFGEEVAGAARDRFLHNEIETYPREIIDAAAAMMHLLPAMMAWLVRRYTQQAIVAGIVENFEALLELRGLPHTPRPETVPALVFADLSGFTELTERRGDDAAALTAASLQRRAERVARTSGGRLVKLLGDGAMLLFPEPEAGVAAALELTSTGDPGLPIHAGVHAGPVVQRDRDVFGRTVNLASRIADTAGPNEVVVTRGVVDAVGSGRFRFEPVGEVELKGVAAPVSLFRATSAGSDDSRDRLHDRR
jgi:class 3 adenylate cyclase